MLERDPGALCEELGLGCSEHYRADASLSRAGSGGRGLRSPGNSDPVVSRAQTGDHPVKTVGGKRGLIQVELARYGYGTYSQEVKQVGADLHKPVVKGDRRAGSHDRRGLTTKRSDRNLERYSSLRRGTGRAASEGTLERKIC